MDFFRELDTDNQGFLTASHLEKYFAEDEDFVGFNFLNLVKHWNGHNEDRLSYVDLKEGISPYPGSRGRDYGGSSSYGRYRDEEQKAAQDKAWKSQLKLVIYLTGQHLNKPETEVIPSMTHEEAQMLWESLDNYNYGYVSANIMSRWLADWAQFNLSIDDTHFLYSCFEVREVTARIDAEQFIKVLAGPTPEEEENADDSKVQEESSPKTPEK